MGERGLCFFQLSNSRNASTNGGFQSRSPLAPIIGSFSGLGGFLVGNGPIQWALAAIMVLAACTGIFFVAKRFQEHRL